jgi:hypothetical protein
MLEPRGPAVRAGERFVMLRIGRTRMALDQRDLVGLEGARDLPSAALGVGVAEFESAGRRWPVFALTESLRVDERPATRPPICALLIDGAARFGLLVEEVALLDGAQVTELGLPDAMRRPGSPLLALMHWQRQLLLRSSAALLAAHVGFDAERRSALALRNEALA